MHDPDRRPAAGRERGRTQVAVVPDCLDVALGERAHSYAAFLAARPVGAGADFTLSTMRSASSGSSFSRAIAASDPWATFSSPNASQLPRFSTTPRAIAASMTEPSQEIPHA